MQTNYYAHTQIQKVILQSEKVFSTLVYIINQIQIIWYYEINKYALNHTTQIFNLIILLIAFAKLILSLKYIFHVKKILVG